MKFRISIQSKEIKQLSLITQPKTKFSQKFAQYPNPSYTKQTITTTTRNIRRPTITKLFRITSNQIIGHVHRTPKRPTLPRTNPPATHHPQRVLKFPSALATFRSLSDRIRISYDTVVARTRCNITDGHNGRDYAWNIKQQPTNYSARRSLSSDRPVSLRYSINQTEFSDALTTRICIYCTMIPGRGILGI